MRQLCLVLFLVVSVSTAAAAATCWQDQIGGVWHVEGWKPGTHHVPAGTHHVPIVGTYFCQPGTAFCASSGYQFYGMVMVEEAVARLVLTLHYPVVHPVDPQTWIYYITPPHGEFAIDLPGLHGLGIVTAAGGFPRGEFVTLSPTDCH